MYEKKHQIHGEKVLPNLNLSINHELKKKYRREKKHPPFSVCVRLHTKRKEYNMKKPFFLNIRMYIKFFKWGARR